MSLTKSSHTADYTPKMVGGSIRHACCIFPKVHSLSHTKYDNIFILLPTLAINCVFLAA